MTDVTPSPSELWHEALDEHPGDPAARRARYQELMLQHGHLVDNTCDCGCHTGEVAHAGPCRCQRLPCGFPLTRT